MGAGVAISEQIARSRAPEQQTHVQAFFAAAERICSEISFGCIEELALELDQLRARYRQELSYTYELNLLGEAQRLRGVTKRGR